MKDWNKLIEKFHEISTDLWDNKLLTVQAQAVQDDFFKQVTLNAPGKAEKVLENFEELSNKLKNGKN